MNLLLAGKTGWGKSRECQRHTETNAGRPGETGETDDSGPYDHVLVLDYKDEYRGLVSPQHGPRYAYAWKAGERELDHFETEHYRQLLVENGNVVLARHRLTDDEWRDLAADAVTAARNLANEENVAVLVVIDEAHFVAPQREGYPKPLKGLATTGRGEGASAMWVSQRLAEMDETVLAQCEGRFLGGFGSDADLGKVEKVVEYPSDLHRAGGANVPLETVPDPLAVDVTEADTVPPVRKWEENGSVVGSEWVYSGEDGTLRRINSGDYDLETEHVGAEGHDIEVGV